MSDPTLAQKSPTNNKIQLAQPVKIDRPRPARFEALMKSGALVKRSDVAHIVNAMMLLTSDTGERRGIEALAMALGVEVQR